MTLAVRDSDLQFAAITLSPHGLNPSILYHSGDVVVLSLLGDTPTTVTLDGVGDMTMLGSFAAGTKGSVWAVLTTLYDATSSFTFAYSGSDFQYSALALSVSGTSVMPTLTSSAHSYTSPPSNGLVISVAQPSAATSMSIQHVEARASSWSLPDPTITLTETNVPTIHAVNSTPSDSSSHPTVASAAFGVDFYAEIRDTWRWSVVMDKSVFDGDVPTARWDLDFSDACAAFDYRDTAASIVGGLSTPLPTYSAGDVLLAQYTSGGGGIAGWTTIAFSAENFGAIAFRIADGSEGSSLTLPSGANGFPAVVSSWTPNQVQTQSLLFGFGPFYGASDGLTGDETSSVAGTDTLFGDFGVLSRAQLAPTGEISTMMIAVMENSSFPSGYHWNHGTERASGTLSGAWSYSVADGIHDITSASTGVDTNPSIHWPVATSSIFVGGLEYVCGGAFPTSVWDVLSSVATIDHSIVIGVEPDQHHAERHNLHNELDHSGGFMYKVGAGVQTFADSDTTAYNFPGGAADGMVAVTYDSTGNITLLWTRLNSIWVSAEVTA